MKTVLVSAVALIEPDGRILLAKRQEGKSMAGLWEFPGGKVENDEDIYTAIIREIDEELQCDIDVVEQFNEHTHEYDTFIINLIAIKSKIIKGAPTPNEHSQLIWLKRENLESLVWAPADIPAVKQLINEK